MNVIKIILIKCRWFITLQSIYGHTTIVHVIYISGLISKGIFNGNYPQWSKKITAEYAAHDSTLHINAIHQLFSNSVECVSSV